MGKFKFKSTAWWSDDPSWSFKHFRADVGTVGKQELGNGSDRVVDCDCCERGVAGNVRDVSRDDSSDLYGRVVSAVCDGDGRDC